MYALPTINMDAAHQPDLPEVNTINADVDIGGVVSLSVSFVRLRNTRTL